MIGLEELMRRLAWVTELKECFASDDVFYREYPDDDAKSESTWNHLNELQVALEVAAAYARTLMSEIEERRFERELRKMDERIRQSQDAPVR